MRSVVLVLGLAGLLSSCATFQRAWLPTVQNVPSDLRVGAGPEHVLKKMGHPSYRRERPDGSSVWTYNDLWWNDRSWGSWELFFTREQRLTGWKLIDPPSNQDFNRSAFFEV
ncbi:MAG: hypothetical protein AAGA96_01130 [Verrucomicrobiota bacterium]